MNIGATKFPAPHADKGWNVERYGRYMTPSGSRGLCKGEGYGFHANGYGVTLCTKELKEGLSSMPGAELSYMKSSVWGSFDVDTMQVRYKRSFSAMCPHEDGWTYLLDYGDERGGKDDIP